MNIMTKNILFIMPPLSSINEVTGKSVASYKEIPYGILSIAAYLKAYSKLNIKIEILDLNTTSNTNFKEIFFAAVE